VSLDVWLALIEHELEHVHGLVDRIRIPVRLVEADVTFLRFAQHLLRRGALLESLPQPTHHVHHHAHLGR